MATLTRAPAAAQRNNRESREDNRGASTKEGREDNRGASTKPDSRSIHDLKTSSPETGFERKRLGRSNAGVARTGSILQVENESPDSLENLSLVPRKHGGNKPWEDPDRAKIQKKLLGCLPDIEAKLKSTNDRKVREGAEDVRELSQGSPETVCKVAKSSLFWQLVSSLKSEDPSVVEELTISVCQFSETPEAAARLVELGIMPALSLAFMRATERTPRPHFSIQGNICAAFLSLSAASKSSTTGLMVGGTPLVRGLVRMMEPDSGADPDSRRRALQLMLMLSQRNDQRGKVVEQGGVAVAVANVEAQEDELYEELAALFHSFSKMDEAGKQLCGALPLSEPGVLSSRSVGFDRRERTETGSDRSLLSRNGTERNGAILRASTIGTPVVDHKDQKESEGSRGLAAICTLLQPQNTPMTLELALCVLTRLVTRGIPLMTHLVKEQPGLLQALRKLSENTSEQRCRKKALALLDLLTKFTYTESNGETPAV